MLMVHVHGVATMDTRPGWQNAWDGNDFLRDGTPATVERVDAAAHFSGAPSAHGGRMRNASFDRRLADNGQTESRPRHGHRT
jgi:hypothetical protein